MVSSGVFMFFPRPLVKGFAPASHLSLPHRRHLEAGIGVKLRFRQGGHCDAALGAVRRKHTTCWRRCSGFLNIFAEQMWAGHACNGPKRTSMLMRK